ncbi:hypothetical protein N9H39_05725 [Gammaproteobacteria bacterium]|nr:hypothetical protein [Gammaproteobacteria bacterium]
MLQFSRQRLQRKTTVHDYAESGNHAHHHQPGPSTHSAFGEDAEQVVTIGDEDGPQIALGHGRSDV